MITIPLLTCIVGLLIHVINAKTRSPDSELEFASRWMYILGLAFTLAGVIGKTAL